MSGDAELFAALASAPEPTAGWITYDEELHRLGVLVATKQRTAAQAELAGGSGGDARLCLVPFDVNCSPPSLRPPAYAVPHDGVKLVSPSRSGKYLAVVRDTGDGAQVIEVSCRGRLVARYAPNTKAPQHGAIYTDAWFGGLAWFEPESALVFVAERTCGDADEKGRRFFGSDDVEAADSGMGTIVGAHEYRCASPSQSKHGYGGGRGEDWGETYCGKASPALFVLYLPWHATGGQGEGLNLKCSVAVVPGIPPHISAGQPSVWRSDDGGGVSVLFVGWDAAPRRLGMTYCYQRPCKVYLACMTSHAPDVTVAQCLTPEVSVARSPRVLSCGTRFAYLASAGDAAPCHNNCFRLCTGRLPLPPTTTAPANEPHTELVGIVEVPAGAGAFPGMYGGPCLPRALDWARKRDASEIVDTPSRVTSRNAKFQKIWDELKKRGWTYKEASSELVGFIYVRPGEAKIQHAKKNEYYFESEAAVLKWVETFYAGWRECIALTDELGEHPTFADVWALLKFHGWRSVKAPLKVLECEGGYAYLPPETECKSDWYAGKRHVSWFTSKDVIEMTWQLRKERKDERDMLHAEEDVRAGIIVCQTVWGCFDAVIAVHTDGSGITRLAPEGEENVNYQLLDVRWHKRFYFVLVARSTPLSPHVVELWEVGRADANVAKPGARAAVLRRYQGPAPQLPRGATERLAAASWKVMRVDCDSDSGGSGRAQRLKKRARKDVCDELKQQSNTCEAILITPGAADAGPAALPPLVAMPHGGPHSATTCKYVPTAAFLCVAGGGAAILHVNYRGSLGQGRAALQSLLGRCGQQDVADVDAAVSAALARGAGDAQRVCVVGGSHGGFLGAHMVAQHAGRYRAACLRNPVTDIASMVHRTDIPDWCFVECGLPFDFARGAKIPSAEELLAMRAASPIARLGDIRAPVLLLLGECDRRVPPSVGLDFYHQMRAHGRGAAKTCARIMRYPKDTHAIDTPSSEADAWLHILFFLRQHVF